MFGFWKRRCLFCGSQVSSKQALRAPNRADGVVCRTCFDQWERTGRRCAECDTVVTGMQEVGAFVQRRALGHADCGGVRLFAA